jgi:hypothetical protein
MCRCNLGSLIFIYFTFFQIDSVQIGHDGDNILSDWDLEYVSIYVEHMEEFYVFRNIKQQWVKEGNDLTLHREGKILNRLSIYIENID